MVNIDYGLLKTTSMRGYVFGGGGFAHKDGAKYGSDFGVSFGYNAGVGGDYALAKKIKGYVEYERWSSKYLQAQSGVNIGLAYCF